MDADRRMDDLAKAIGTSFEEVREQVNVLLLGHKRSVVIDADSATAATEVETVTGIYPNHLLTPWAARKITQLLSPKGSS